MVRQYCNTLRAAAVTLSIEVAMGAEITKGVLAAVPDPEGAGVRLADPGAEGGPQDAAGRGRAADAAKNAAACHSTFQQEYEEEINRVRHRAPPSAAAGHELGPAVREAVDGTEQQPPCAARFP